MKTDAVFEKDDIRISAKKPLKELYRGVRLPVLRTLLGSLLHVAGTIIVATQADSLARIAVGEFGDLSPIFTYALMLLIGYVFFYASVIADLGFVELAAKIRKKIWNKTMRLPLNYYDREGRNKVISRITNDPEYSYLPFKLLQMTFTLIVLFLIVLTGDAAVKELALVLIAGFLLTMGAMFIASKYSERGALFVAAKLSSLTAFLAERFGKIAFIKAMNSEEKETRTGIRYIDERYEADKYNAMANTLVLFGQGILTVFLFAAAFFIGAFMIRKGSVPSTTALVAFYAYGGNLNLVFQFFAQFPSVFAQTRGGSRKIVSILEEREEELDEGKKEFDGTGDILLEDVSFAYTGKNAVDQVNLIIPRGKTTAIIGHNGSGKSTILKLIDRLYPDHEGNIRIGEENGRDISLRAWRDRFGIVSQNAALFDGSVRENICYGVENAGEEEIRTVVSLACLDDLIDSHEGGLDFRVGVNGEKLSGGEQQRIAIARAMLKNPDILILDEATANLDPITEKKVRNSISALTCGRTSVIVAHTGKAVEDADQVIVMRNGRVEDQGTPEELSLRNDYYKAFVKA